MTMKNPVHPGLLVKDCIEHYNFTEAETAKILKITRQQVYNIVSCKSSISPRMAIRLEKAFGSSARNWLAMQSNYDLAQERIKEEDVHIERLAPA